MGLFFRLMLMPRYRAADILGSFRRHPISEKPLIFLNLVGLFWHIRYFGASSKTTRAPIKAPLVQSYPILAVSAAFPTRM